MRKKTLTIMENNRKTPKQQSIINRLDNDFRSFTNHFIPITLNISQWNSQRKRKNEIKTQKQQHSKNVSKLRENMRKMTKPNFAPRAPALFPSNTNKWKLNGRAMCTQFRMFV